MTTLRRLSWILFASLYLAGDAAAETNWRIVALDNGRIIGEPSLRFSEDGRISGETGCNRFQATARVEEARLLVEDPVATTRMACPAAALAAQEDAILGLFEGEMRLVYDPFTDGLTLSGSVVLSLTRDPVMPSIFDELLRPHLDRDRPSGDPPYLAGFGTAGDLVLRRAPSMDSEPLTEVDLGTVLRNDGCEGDWCRVELPNGTASGWAERRYLEEADSALRAGQNIFDATGVVPCSFGAGAPMTQCTMGVARDEGGSATVVVQRGDGFQRALFFRNGTFFSTDSSEAGGGFETSATHEADLFRIRIDDERYEIPDAAVFGG
jgi:heat shock protein HslJ